MAVTLAYRWDGRRSRLYFQTREGNYNDAKLIEFVRQLRRHFRGEQVILLWDGLPSHRSRRMLEFLADQKDWLEVRRLPGYAPESNPAEGFWANLKGRELANRCETRVRRLDFVARLGADRVRGDRRLLFGFLRHTGLTLGSARHAL
jgi:transposase